MENTDKVFEADLARWHTLRQIDVGEAAAKKVLAEVSNRRDTVKMFLK